MKFLSIVFMLVSITACSTHMTTVNYEGSGHQRQVGSQKIHNVFVSDDRGTDDNWLGAIRGGYGNRLKTLRTTEPTAIVVKNMYVKALEESGVLSSDSSARYDLKIAIEKFDCSYYFNREAHAHLHASLVDRSTSHLVFSKRYKVDEVESGMGAGIFGDVDTLRELAELAMNKAIDKTLSDQEFIDALSNAPVNDVANRLKKVDELYKSGVISEKEYQEKRQSILSDI